MTDPILRRPSLQAEAGRKQSSGELDLTLSLQNLSLASSTNLPPSSPTIRIPSATDRRSPSPLVVRKRSSLGVGQRSQPGTPVVTPIKRHASYSTLPMNSPPPTATNGASVSISRKTSITSLTHSDSYSTTTNGNGGPLPPPLPPLTNQDAETLVILSEFSYLHRFAREWEGAAYKNSIVERPERIVAATLGVSAAVSKLTPSRLSLIKTDRTASLADPAVKIVHGEQYPPALTRWCEESAGKLAAHQVELPEVGPTGETISYSDMYLCPETRKDLEGCLGALFEATDRVFQEQAIKNEGFLKTEYPKAKRAFVCIRPPGHHCGESTPAGFCFVNNVQVAISYAARVHGLTHAAILDFDLHHGDGSQDIAWSLNQSRFNSKGSTLPTIAYYSLHDIKSYPCEAGNPEKIINASTCLEDAFGQNIWNVHLEAYADEQHFWELYDAKYNILLTKARNFLQKAKATHKPAPRYGNKKFKAGVFISAGFDASHYEGQHMQRHAVNVPTSFFARFTEDAVKIAEEYAEGRVLSVLEGGYEDRALWTGVFSHLCGLAAPHGVPAEPERPMNTPRVATRPQLGGLGTQPAEDHLLLMYPQLTFSGYDPSWFAYPTHLKLVEDAVTTTQQKKIERETSYFSPTAASSAKVTTPSQRLKRQSSSTFSPGGDRLTPSPTPPLKPMEWGELSSMIWFSLVPQTEISPLKPIAKAGLKPEKRLTKRHSVVGVPEIDAAKVSSGRTLRERKKPTIPVLEEQPAPLPVRTTKTTAANSRRAASSAAVSHPSTTQRVSTAAMQRAASVAGTARKSEGAAARTRTTGRNISPPSTNGVTIKKETKKQENVPPARNGAKAAPSSTGRPIANGQPVVPPRTTSVDKVSNNVAKLKITYKNKERDQLQQLRTIKAEAEEEQLRMQIKEHEDRIQRAQGSKKLDPAKKGGSLRTYDPVSKSRPGIQEMSAAEERLRDEMLESKLREMDLENADKPTQESKPPKNSLQHTTPLASRINPALLQASVSAPPSANPSRIKTEPTSPSPNDTSPGLIKRGPWHFGQELTPARVYRPIQPKSLAPHGTGALGQDDSLKKEPLGVDMDRVPAEPSLK